MGPRNPRHLGEQADGPQPERGCKLAVLYHDIEGLHQAHLYDWKYHQVEFVWEVIEARAAPPGRRLDLPLQLPA